MDNGLPVTPAAAIARNLLRTADFLPFLYAFAIVAMLMRRDCKRLGDQPKSGGQPLRMRDFKQGAFLGDITHDARDDRPPAQGDGCVHTRLPAPELASLCAPHALDSHD